jgi:hypothetical protein
MWPLFLLVMFEKDNEHKCNLPDLPLPTNRNELHKKNRFDDAIRNEMSEIEFKSYCNFEDFG